MSKLKYLALSETGGIITDDSNDQAYTLNHEGNEIVASPTPKGGRPTIMNREFAESFLLEHAERGTFACNEISAAKIDKAANQPRYKYTFPNQSEFSPEYQLYLARELEREIIRKSSKIKEDKHALKELSGLLPHEEEQEGGF